MKYTIIGAGIGGLTTALAFEKKGIDYQIFERSTQLNEVGAGIWLAPNALKVLKSLDIYENVRKEGNTIDRITLAEADLSPITDSNQGIIKEKFGFSTIAIHRAKLQKLLFEQLPKEKIQLGKSLSHFEQTSTGSVLVNFEDKTTTETNYLIGADGINSRVRQQLFPTSKKRYSGQTCWRGIALYRLDKDFQNRGMELWGKGIRFGISQISEDSVYWFAVERSKPGSENNVTTLKRDLLTKFSEFYPLVSSLIEATTIDKILKNDIFDLVPLDKWYHGNCCLIGDACHATTPNMGQGGAQAIEDAHYLSYLITQHPEKNTFGLFEALRKEKVNTIVRQSWTTGKLAHWKYGRRLRNILLASIPQSMLDQKMSEMYHVEFC